MLALPGAVLKLVADTTPSTKIPADQPTAVLMESRR